MARLLIHVEGETEESFVNEVLEGHLCAHGYHSVSARLLGNSRQRANRGGIRPWNSVRSDIVKHLKEDSGCLATTMVDYYGLPESGFRGWPGRELAARLPFAEKALVVQRAIHEEVVAALGGEFDGRRFLPFVMMHEFEGLLFSDCEGFGRGIGRPELAPQFQSIRNQFSCPEEINDSPVTAPSKRVRDLVESYEKPFQGTLAVIEIGLDSIRTECPNFRAWLEKLEAWPAQMLGIKGT